MNNQNIIFFFILGLFLASTVLVAIYTRYATQRGIIDAPNSRRPHQGFIPRGAGIVFLCLWLLAAILGYQTHLLSIETLILFLPITCLISLIGFWDDYKGLSARRRLIIQFIFATIFMLEMFGIVGFEESSLLQRMVSEQGFVLTVFCFILGLLGIIWSINLYNFMDGLDGIASIEALFVLGMGSLFCYQHGAFELSLLALMMLVSVAGFLVWNWPKAYVFMGDVGSYCLGCFISLLALVGYWKYQIPITLWLILYALFWFDASLTLIRRLFAKKNIITPHQDHAYQRLYSAGYSQHRVLLGVIVLNAILAMLAFYADYQSDYLEICFASCILLLLLVTVWIEKQKPLLKTSSGLLGS